MKINLKKSNIPIKINEKKYFDKRGYFQEIYLRKRTGLNIKLLLAKSKKMLLGLHFQLKNQQTKLIHVIDGKILDVVINLKKNQETLVGSLSLFLKKAIFYLSQKIMVTATNV